MRGQKKKKRIMIALVSAAIVAFMVLGYMNSLQSSIAEKESTLAEKNRLLQELQEKAVDVKQVMSGPSGYALVSKGNLYQGTRLRADMLELKEVSLTDIEDKIFQDAEALVGKVVTSTVIAGQPVLKTNVDLNSFYLPNGMRAVTIPMEFIQGFASYINVGSRIDLVSASNKDESEIILQNIKILAFEKGLATQSNTNSSSPQPNAMITAITFEIPANVSSELISAVTKGRIQILLRNTSDKSKVKVQKKAKPNPNKNMNMGMGMNAPFPPPAGLPPLNNLKPTFPQLPAPASPVDSAPVKSGPSVEVIKAGEKQDVSFSDEDL